MNVLLMRLLWIGVAAGFALLASVFFHRFDPARSWRKLRPQPNVSPVWSGEVFAMPVPAIPIAAAHLTPLPRNSTIPASPS